MINYILLVHKNPKQVNRLVNRLNSKDCRFYIHVDKKAEMDPFVKTLSHFKNVFFVSEKDRIGCLWGHVSLVYAVFACLNLLGDVDQKGYTILLSGQDYPLKSKAFIQSFFNGKDKDYLECHKFPVSGWGRRGGYEKMDRYWLNLYPDNGIKKVEVLPFSLELRTYTDYVRTFLRNPKLLKQTIPLYFKKREIPDTLVYYGGEFWWILRNKSVKILRETVLNNPELLSFHEYTCTPEEMLFQSILCSNNDIKPNVENKHLRYIDWSAESPHPKIFTQDDFVVLKEKIDNPDDFLFARKFDLDIDSDILDMIDNYIDTTERQ